jgi:hypothetical protein
MIDGSEVIKDYRTSPGIFSNYYFTEVHSDNAILIGNSGILPYLSGQGIWLKQTILVGSSDDASDDFKIGLLFDI